MKSTPNDPKWINQFGQNLQTIQSQLYEISPVSGRLCLICTRKHQMEERKLGLFVCRICGKPVRLEDSEIDAAGHPLHAECAIKAETENSSEDNGGGL
jgi:hypothetical protein